MKRGWFSMYPLYQLKAWHMLFKAGQNLDYQPLTRFNPPTFTFCFRFLLLKSYRLFVSEQKQVTIKVDNKTISPFWKLICSHLL